MCCMMHEGKIVLNIAGEEKKKLTVEDLLRKFEVVAVEEFRKLSGNPRQFNYRVLHRRKYFSKQRNGDTQE